MDRTVMPVFEEAYRGGQQAEGVSAVPWNIGEPQPALAALIDAGEVRGEVLDAGCGVGETTLYLLARGHAALGVDASPTAIGQAREQAERRGVADARFELGDLTQLPYENRFNAVLDSAVLHAVPVGARSAYLASLARAAAPGAVYRALVFTDENDFASETGPNCFGEAELRAAVAEHWTLDSVERATIAARLPPEAAPGAERDAQDRAVLPAYLVRAHLA